MCLNREGISGETTGIFEKGTQYAMPEHHPQPNYTVSASKVYLQLLSSCGLARGQRAGLLGNLKKGVHSLKGDCYLHMERSLDTNSP